MLSRRVRRSSRFLPTLEGMPRRITPSDVCGVPTFESGYLTLDFDVEAALQEERAGGGADGGSVDGTGVGSGYLTLTYPAYSC